MKWIESWGGAAAQIAGNAKRWWHNSRRVVQRILSQAHFDSLGVPKFS